MRNHGERHGDDREKRGNPYRIDENYCVGCKVCMKYCHVDAIIDKILECEIREDVCVGCGRCAYRCPQHAIYQLS